MEKSLITTHVLDTATGMPAADLPVQLFKQTEQGWHKLAEAVTNADGRIMSWSVDDSQLDFGVFKVVFNIEAYLGPDCFYPLAEIVFRRQDDRHHHIPLLLSPFGYSTYRGS